MTPTKTWALPPEILPLPKNSPAPYDGVLMPETIFRQYKEDHDYRVYLVNEEKQIADPCLTTEPKHDLLTAALLGGFIGLITGLIVANQLR